MEQSSSSWLALSCGSAAALWAGGQSRDSKAPPSPVLCSTASPRASPCKQQGSTMLLTAHTVSTLQSSSKTYFKAASKFLFLKAFWAKTPDPSSQGHLQPHKHHHTHTPPVSQAPHNQTPLTCDSGGESLREPHAACPSHSLPRSMKASTALDPHPVPAAQLLPPSKLLLPRVPGVPARHLPGSSEQTGSACCCHAEGRAVQEVAE